MELSKKEDRLTVRKCHFCQQWAVFDGFRFCSACGKQQNLIFTVEVIGNHSTATSTSGEDWKNIPFGRTKVSYVSIRNYEEVLRQIEETTLAEIGHEYIHGHKKYFRRDQIDCLLIHHLADQEVPFGVIEVIVDPFDHNDKKGFNLVIITDRTVDDLINEVKKVKI